jgi:hypothetical protein
VETEPLPLTAADPGPCSHRALQEDSALYGETIHIYATWIHLGHFSWPYLKIYRPSKYPHALLYAIVENLNKDLIESKWNVVFLLL